jgi:mRNA interferase RelE/StbE
MFTVLYHHKIPDDIAGVSATAKKQIQKSIEEKLTIDPQFFGKPLQFSLKGLRSMRVGNYRVIFTLQKKEVFIVLIEHRATVYKTLEKRTGP